MLPSNSCTPDHPRRTRWHFDGATCVDIDDCLGAGNPCGNGICANTLGSYACSCNAVYGLGGTPPTCVADSAGVKVTKSGGGCCDNGSAAHFGSSRSRSPSSLAGVA